MASESSGEIVVVGGGVIGLTTALVLAEQGARAIDDQRPEPEQTAEPIPAGGAA